MPKDNDFRPVDQATGVATVNTATAVTFDNSGTTIDFLDIIVCSLYFEETGGANGYNYSVTLEGHEVASGAVTASQKAAPVNLSGYIGGSLQVLLNSTVADSSATASVKFYGK